MNEDQKNVYLKHKRTSIWQISEGDKLEHENLLKKHDNWHFPSTEPPFQDIKIKPRSAIGNFFLVSFFFVFFLIFFSDHLCLKGHPPNKQETLFPLDKKGPKLLLLVVTLVMFISSIYISLFGYTVANYIHHLSLNIGIKVLLWFLCLFPLLICVYYTHSIICKNIFFVLFLLYFF